MLANQKRLLFQPEVKDSKPLLSQIWNIVLVTMIGYFVVSILNTSVQHKLVEDKH
jgi:hypothetical protein